MKIETLEDAPTRQAELVRQIYAGVPLALLANLCFALALAAIQSDVIPTPAILLWLLLLGAVLGLHSWLFLAYRRANTAATVTGQSARWLKHSRIMTSATGLAWGMAGLLLFPAQDIPHQAFLAFTLAGLSAGAVTSLAADFLSAMIFASLSTAPLALILLTKPDRMQSFMGGMELVFLLFLAFTGKRTQGLLLETSRLRQLDLESSARLHEQEKSLRETEGRFRVIANSAPVLIWMAGTDKLCSFINQTWLDFTGRTIEQETGNGWTNGVHAEDYERCLDTYHRHFDSHLEFTMEYRLRHRNGLYRWVSNHGIPRFDDSGKFVGYIGCCIDIEEIKHIELELRGGREMAKRALQTLQHQKYALDQHAIVATTDVKGRINYANDKFCSISGYSQDELLGQDHILLNSGQHPHGFFKEMYETLARGEVWHNEVCNRAKDGHLYWVDTTVVPFIGSDGKPEQYIAIRADISDRKEAEIELKRHRDHLQDLVLEQTHDLRTAKEIAEHASQAKSEFLANMSHELRTPLHAILSFSELGRNKIDRAPAEKLHGYFDRINRAGDRLLDLLNDLLDLSKLEAGKMVLNKSPLKLLDRLLEATTEFGALLQANRIELKLIPTTCDSTIIDADPFRIGQVLRNLLSNAIKFTPAGGRITIRCSATELRRGRRTDGLMEPAIQLEIIDTGVGIPEDELESIFGKFVQSSKTRSGAGGTGLGLSISREIVEAHHGTLVACNNPGGGGAAFTLTLPVTSRPHTEELTS